MEKAEFIKRFPELDGNEYATRHEDGIDYALFSQGKILAFCISKQRVKEIIDKFSTLVLISDKQNILFNLPILRRELGLEEEK